ncbi:Protein EMBRYO DEFECTIVE 514 [Linum grandiflorum]
MSMSASCVTMLVDLVKQGHPEPDKLIGCGVHSFQVRRKMMCGQFLTFVIVRKDGSKAEFCFKICVNNILPLPDDLKSGGAVCECLIEGGMSGPNVSYLQRLEQEQNRLDDDESLHVYLGPMRFRTFLRMYGFFYTLLLESPLNESLVKENVHEMLLDLLNKGDPELGKKIGNVESFQVRIHPGYGGILRSFYFVRGDGSMEDFCFIKCVDGIFPLSEKANKSLVGPCSCHHEEDGEGVVTLGCKKFRSSNRMLSYVTGFSEELRDGYQCWLS